MTSADASSTAYVDEAADALANGNVFVSSEVAGASALADTLRQQIGDDSIGVAVFSDNAALEASATEIVSTLAERPGYHYDTIVVAVGDDVAAGSRVLDTGEALLIANEAENQADSVSAALTETVQGIQAAEPVSASTGGVSGGAILGVVLAVVAVVAVIGVTIGVVRSRRTRARAERGLPDGVRAHLVALSAVSADYAAAGASGNQAAAQAGREIDVLAGNVSELFRRLDGRTDDGQRELAAVEYDDKLRKLSGALQRDYLLDILTHPNLWDDPAERQREVEGALAAVSQELVENIKQVNARRALHFQVSLDGLMGRRKELQDWDRAFDSATGEGTAPPA